MSGTLATRDRLRAAISELGYIYMAHAREAPWPHKTWITLGSIEWYQRLFAECLEALESASEKEAA